MKGLSLIAQWVKCKHCHEPLDSTIVSHSEGYVVIEVDTKHECKEKVDDTGKSISSPY